jgi:hypothetical protein
MLALARLRTVTGFAPREPSATGGRRRPWRGGRIARPFRRIAPRTRAAGRLPAAAFELEAPDELTTVELWSVWTVAHLESALALTAWRAAPREDRGRAHRAYRVALAREAAAARILAGRHASGALEPAAG